MIKLQWYPVFLLLMFLRLLDAGTTHLRVLQSDDDEAQGEQYGWVIWEYFAYFFGYFNLVLFFWNLLP